LLCELTAAGGSLLIQEKAGGQIWNPDEVHVLLGDCTHYMHNNVPENTKAKPCSQVKITLSTIVIIIEVQHMYKLVPQFIIATNITPSTESHHRCWLSNKHRQKQIFT
jgi:hypothetical protein